jgi:alanine racemase
VSPEDALKIRATEEKHGLASKRILVVGNVAASQVNQLIDNEIECALADECWPQRFQCAGIPEGSKRLQMHLFLDTGLCREGILPERLLGTLKMLECHTDCFEIVALMSHFADAENAENLENAGIQLNRFKAAARELAFIGWVKNDTELHFAASSPAIVFPEARMSGVRIGISLYGSWTSHETFQSAKIAKEDKDNVSLNLDQVISWKCPAQLVKEIPAGEGIGYNRTHVCKKNTTIAVFPVGYFDGYPYLKSGMGHVLIKGRKCPILGNVMMNNIVVDVTGIASLEEQNIIATLLGGDGDENISVEDLAKMANTINYQILTSLGQHLARRLVNT